MNPLTNNTTRHYFQIILIQSRYIKIEIEVSRIIYKIRTVWRQKKKRKGGIDIDTYDNLIGEETSKNGRRHIIAE